MLFEALDEETFQAVYPPREGYIPVDVFYFYLDHNICKLAYQIRHTHTLHQVVIITSLCDSLPLNNFNSSRSYEDCRNGQGTAGQSAYSKELRIHLESSAFST